MTQLNYRANLSAAIFPMTIAKAGRSVIIPQADQNFDRRIDAPGDTQRGSVGVPQVIFGENILPTPDGFQSIGFRPRDPIVAGDDINAVIPIRVATVVTTEEVTVGGEITYSSSGNDLSGWETSPHFVTGASEAQVIQSASAGNPGDAFVLATTANGDVAYQPPYPYVRRNFSPGNPDNSGFEADFEFAVTGTQAALATNGGIRIGLFTSAGGSGYHIFIDLEAGTLHFGTASDINGTGFASLGSDTIVGATTVNRLVVTAVKTVPGAVDHSRNFNITLEDNVAATIAEINVIASVTYGNYIVVSSWTNVAENTVFNSDSFNTTLAVDNIETSGDGEETTTTYTEFTGLVTAYLALISDDTANWSYSLDAWENNAVTVPGTFESPLTPNQVSVANVRGMTYICIRHADETTRIYIATVDTGTDTIDLEDITTTIDGTLPNGYSVNSILGICSSYNYLILFTGGTILWSSTTTPTDFAPSLVSGAGNEVPGNLKGDITFLREHVSGFFIYSTKNVLFAQYTGNQRYPWRFREVGQSGGFSFSTQVSGDTNSSVQYGVNNSKFVQVLNPEAAELVAPEVTDFIERTKRWDIFEQVGYTFSLSDPTLELIITGKPTAWFVLDRYLLLPYGEYDTNEQWTYVIVFDLLLRRYGKLKIITDFCLSDEENTFFINRITGAISKLYFDILEYDADEEPYGHEGVIILGKFQYVRDNFICLDELTVDAVQNIDELVDPDDRNFNVRILPSLDGRSFIAPVTPFDNTDTTQNLDGMQFLSRVSCQNFALALTGAFDLNTVALTFHPEGDN